MRKLMFFATWSFKISQTYVFRDPEIKIVQKVIVFSNVFVGFRSKHTRENECCSRLGASNSRENTCFYDFEPPVVLPSTVRVLCWDNVV
mgnify:CR=1 FL=1